MSVASHSKCASPPSRASAATRRNARVTGSYPRSSFHVLSARMASAYIPRTSSNVVASSPDRDELGPPLAAASRRRARVRVSASSSFARVVPFLVSRSASRARRSRRSRPARLVRVTAATHAAASAHVAIATRATRAVEGVIFRRALARRGRARGGGRRWVVTRGTFLDVPGAKTRAGNARAREKTAKTSRNGAAERNSRYRRRARFYRVFYYSGIRCVLESIGNSYGVFSYSSTL